jgi:antitoxin (DNA-binding transcriptional repressor) of toxin-antitoxin stability system
MKRVSVAKASRSLGEYATELEDEIVVVTECNRPVAALVPLKGIDCEALAVSTHPDFLRLIERSRAELEAGKSLTLAEMQRHVASIATTGKRRRSVAAKRNGR